MAGPGQEPQDTAMIVRFIDKRIVPPVLYGSVVVVLLLFYVPIITLIAFSFRSGRHLVLPFDGVTTDWYISLFHDAAFKEAAWNSLVIATLVMVVSTVCGTLLAIALVRFSFRFRTALAFLNLTPLLFPQLLLGIVLLLWFSVLGNWLDFSLGVFTTIAGHVAYIIPFAAIVIAVRLASLDPQLEHAARDCGASTWDVYRHVTVPLLWPGILSAAIFSFLLSWSNFYISFNLSGTTSVLPTFVYAGLAFNSSPAYPAIATLVLVPMIALVILAEVLRRRSLPHEQQLTTGETYA
jgi:spermidine/putrescine transport system permease protein